MSSLRHRPERATSQSPGSPASGAPWVGDERESYPEGVGSNDDGATRLKELESQSKSFETILGVVFSRQGIEVAPRTLWFYGREVTDEELAAVRAFPSIRRLDLIETSGISGGGLNHLEPLQNLDELILVSSSAATDEGMVHVGRRSSLRILHLNANGITDTGLESLAALVNLEWLHLEHNDITDQGVRILSRMTKLRWLDLSCPRVSDACLQSLLPLSQLEQLSLCGTSVSDDGIEALNRLPKLKFVNLHGSRVSKQGLARLRPEMAYRSKLGSKSSERDDILEQLRKTIL